ncbi:MAG: hypothetical protein ACRED4_04325 [Brevundimonas sp.]
MKGAVASTMLLATVIATPVSAGDAATVAAGAFKSGCLEARGERAWSESGWERLPEAPDYLAPTLSDDQSVWRGAATDGYVLAYQGGGILGCTVSVYGPAGDFLSRVEADGHVVGLTTEMVEADTLTMRGLIDDAMASLVAAVVDHTMKTDHADPSSTYATYITLKGF